MILNLNQNRINSHPCGYFQIASISLSHELKFCVMDVEIGGDELSLMLVFGFCS